MKFEASIIPLVLMFTAVVGKSDAYEDSRVTRTLSQSERDGQNRWFYPCRFDFRARCMWKVNGKYISISDSGYKWKTGNGSNTKDCSIEPKSIHTQWLSYDPKGDKVECTGIGNGPVKVLIGHYIELQCPVNDRRSCYWIRNNQKIEMNHEYQFSNDRDCSIRINEIQRVDLTQWKCHNRNAPQWPRAIYTLAEQTQTEQQTAYPTSETDEVNSNTTTTSRDTITVQSPTSEIQNTNNSSPTVAVTEFPTSQINSTTLNSTESSPTDNLTLMSSDETNTKTSTTMIAMAENSIEGTATSAVQPNQSVPTALVATIIVLSIVIVIGGVAFAWIFRERMKKRNTTHDDNRHNHDGAVREALPSTSNAHHSYGHVKASTSQTETEDDDGYLIAIQLNTNTNTKSTNNTKRNSDPKNHVYATIKDDIYTNVQHPSGNSQTYTVLF